jgi:hypothetical protein
LRFLVDTQHERLVRRVEVEATNLLHKEGIGGQLERALPMGLDPNACHAQWMVHLGIPVAPSIVRQLHCVLATDFVHRSLHEYGNLLIDARAGTAWAELIMQTGEAIRDKPLPPLSHGRVRHT